MGPNPIWPYKKKRERHDGCLHTEERPCEDIVRRLPYTRQEDRPPKMPIMQTPWSCISSLLNCEEINFCCSSHPDPVCGILLCSPSRRIHQPISLILLHFQKVHSFNIHHNICKFSKLWHLDACLRRKTEVSLIPSGHQVELQVTVKLSSPQGTNKEKLEEERLTYTIKKYM